MARYDDRFERNLDVRDEMERWENEGGHSPRPGRGGWRENWPTGYGSSENRGERSFGQAIPPRYDNHSGDFAYGHSRSRGSADWRNGGDSGSYSQERSRHGSERQMGQAHEEGYQDGGRRWGPQPSSYGSDRPDWRFDDEQGGSNRGRQAGAGDSGRNFHDADREYENRGGSRGFSSYGNGARENYGGSGQTGTRGESSLGYGSAGPFGGGYSGYGGYGGSEIDHGRGNQGHGGRGHYSSDSARDTGGFNSGQSGFYDHGSAGLSGGSLFALHQARRNQGPKGYTRSDARLKEDVSDRFMQDSYIDSSDIEIEVTGGVVLLKGTVGNRREKYMAEELAEGVLGVNEVENQLRVKRADSGKSGAEEGPNKGQSADAGRTPRRNEGGKMA